MAEIETGEVRIYIKFEGAYLLSSVIEAAGRRSLLDVGSVAGPAIVDADVGLIPETIMS